MEYLQQAYFANLNAVCRDGGDYDFRPGQIWALGEHAHTQNKFYFLTEGSCQLTFENQQYVAKAGDWFFIPTGTKHSYSHLPDTPFRKYWLHFDLYPNDAMAQMLHLPRMVQVGNDPRATKLFQELTQANSSRMLTDTLRAKAALLSLLALYVELSHADGAPAGGEEARRAQEVLSFIHKHLPEPMSNARLAAVCHMHPNHFIRWFSKMTGQTPAVYVTGQRMQAAKRLLEQTDLPVSAIMEQIGLTEPSHFARLFRRACSMTPTQYRKQHKK